MPRYEFFCHNCKKLFSKILSLVDYEEGEVICPHCGSKNIEQCWSAFNAITSKKSAWDLKPSTAPKAVMSLSLTGEYGFAGLSLGRASGALP